MLFGNGPLVHPSVEKLQESSESIVVLVEKLESGP